MSVDALRAAFTYSASTGAARLVLLAMADEASTEGYLTAYRRSRGYLAKKANVDARTVHRAIAALVELGEVEVLTVGDGRTQSDYRLHLRGLGDGGPTVDRDGEPVARCRSSRGDRSPSLRGGDTPPGGGDTPSPSSPSTPTATHSVVTSREQLTLVGPQTPAAQHMAVGQNLGSDRDLAFVEFWRIYPLKAGKGQARKAWATARRRGVRPEVIVAGAQRYADDPNRDPAYTRHPATWLNGEGWDDDPLPDRTARPGRAPTAMAGTMSRLAQVAAVGGPVIPPQRGLEAPRGQ